MALIPKVPMGIPRHGPLPVSGPPDIPTQLQPTPENINLAFGLMEDGGYSRVSLAPDLIQLFNLMRSMERLMDPLATQEGYVPIRNRLPSIRQYIPKFYPPMPVGVRRPPTSELIQPTGGLINPLVDYSTSLEDRMRRLGTSRLDIPAQMAAEDISFGHSPLYRSDYAGSYQRGRKPMIDIAGQHLYQELSSDQHRMILEHELIHALLEDKPNIGALLATKPSVQKLLGNHPNKQWASEAMGLGLPDPSHILTGLMGRGGYGLGDDTNIRYLEDVPEDIQPFAEGFYPRRVR